MPDVLLLPLPHPASGTMQIDKATVKSIIRITFFITTASLLSVKA